MNTSLHIIPFGNLAISFLPVLAVIIIHYRWDRSHGNAIYAVGRMLVQLLLIGYLLTFIFASDSAWVILGVLTVMVAVSSWIALRTIRHKQRHLYTRAVWSILAGGGTTLLLISQGVLELTPWYLPRYIIPLAGMVFANAMNSVSLAADRLEAETGRNVEFEQARNIAFRASLIPITNSLFAVGLVSIPGMMTGQILSGISPLIAARYQIMVMCMIFGAAGISSACFLTLVRDSFLPEQT